MCPLVDTVNVEAAQPDRDPSAIHALTERSSRPWSRRSSRVAPIAPLRLRIEFLRRTGFHELRQFKDIFQFDANLHPWNIQRSEFGKSCSPSRGGKWLLGPVSRRAAYPLETRVL